MGALVWVSGKKPRAMSPEKNRVFVPASTATDDSPFPDTKVEKTRPSPAGVSLVRKPETGLAASLSKTGTSAFRVGKPVAVVVPAM